MTSNPDFLRRVVDRGLLEADAADNLARQYGEHSLGLVLHLLREDTADKITLGRLWGDALGVAYMELDKTLFQPDIVNVLPRAYAMEHGVIPLYKLGETVSVAMVDPANERMIDELRERFDAPIAANFSFPADIEDAIKQQYDNESQAETGLRRGTRADAHALAPLMLTQTNRDLVETALSTGRGLLVVVSPDADDRTLVLKSLIKRLGRKGNEAIPAITDRDSARDVFDACDGGARVLAAMEADDALAAWKQLLAWEPERAADPERLRALVSCRHLQRVCHICRTPYLPEREMVSRFFAWDGDTIVRFHRGDGCDRCGESGMLGSVPVTEVWPLNRDLAGLAPDLPDDETVYATAERAGYRGMHHDAVLKMLKGETTPEEVDRVFGPVPA